MNKYSKFLLSVIGSSLVFVGAINVAAAADDEKVMFKIHDIVPEKDADGKVVYCNASATFYNKTTSDITKANMNLVWYDEVIDDTINKEKREELKREKEGNKASAPRHNTAEYVTKDISVLIRLPQIRSKQQLSLKTKIDTDRCFLLLKDMEYSVNECIISSSGEGASSNSTDCSTMFEYVSPSAPEYYIDFKEVSYETQVMNDNTAVLNMKSEIEEMYDSAINNIKKIVQTEVEAEEK